MVAFTLTMYNWSWSLLRLYKHMNSLQTQLDILTFNHLYRWDRIRLRLPPSSSNQSCVRLPKIQWTHACSIVIHITDTLGYCNKLSSSWGFWGMFSPSLPLQRKLFAIASSFFTDTRELKMTECTYIHDLHQTMPWSRALLNNQQSFPIQTRDSHKSTN